MVAARKHSFRFVLFVIHIASPDASLEHDSANVYWYVNLTASCIALYNKQITKLFGRMFGRMPPNTAKLNFIYVVSCMSCVAFTS